MDGLSPGVGRGGVAHDLRSFYDELPHEAIEWLCTMQSGEMSELHICA